MSGSNGVATRPEMRAGFRLGKPDRLVPHRSGIGGTGDYQAGTSTESQKRRAWVRDLEQNEPLVAVLVDRAVENQLQDRGLQPRPQTGDVRVDEAIVELWNEWANDPNLCDYHDERSFWELTWIAQSTALVEGEMFAVLTDEGTVQAIEPARVISPAKQSANIVDGVELDGRKRVAFWVARDPGAARDTQDAKPRRVPKIDANGHKAFLHLYNPKTMRRISQTRGVSAFAPLWNRMAFIETRQWAENVKAIALATIAFVLERSDDWTGGSAEIGTATQQVSDAMSGIGGDGGDANTYQLEEIKTGQVLRHPRGETAKVLAADVPSAGFREHYKILMLEISANMGVPMIMAFLDGSETNFSGFRGAVESAKTGWRVQHRALRDKWYRPVYQWKVRQWLAAGRLPKRMNAKAANNLLRHEWSAPTWPYISPLDDAKAATEQLGTGQISPSQNAAKNDQYWPAQISTMVKDYGDLIEAAQKRADSINKRHPTANAHWRDVANLRPPAGLTLSGAIEPPTDTGPPTPVEEPTT